MNDTHRVRSKLQVEKFFNMARKYCTSWLQSTKYYSSEVLFDVLTYSAMERISIEQAANYLKEQKFAPSGETVRNQIRKQFSDFSKEEISEFVNNLLLFLIRRMPHFRGNRKPSAILALDLHDEEYYGKPLYVDNTRITFRTPPGARIKSDYCFRYATLAIVQLGNIPLPLTVSFSINVLNQPRKEVVQQLLEQVKLPLKIKSLLMDGGFASVDVLHYLDYEVKIPWLTRGKFSSKKEYLGDVNEDWFPYYLSDNYAVAAYLVEYKGSSGQVLFLCSKLWTYSSQTIIELYRKRFRIENTYRQSRVLKIRTSTRDVRLRWILWAFSHFLELLWEIMRFVHQIQQFSDELITEYRFKRIISAFLEKLIPNYC